MLNTIKLFSFFLFVTFIIPTHAANKVGLTAGQFRVDESGAATYSMPINIPQGRAGVTPQVALSYSSNNLSEGPLGVGWSLSGLSAISRCPQTPIHDDGNIQGVEYTSEDKFCLNGQRLFIVGGIESNYGMPDTSYYTEIDSLSTITAKGQATENGPLYFEVKNKAGETHYYGNAQSAHSSFLDQSDAFVEPGGFDEGSLARIWAIKVIKDVKDNYILFNYDEVTADGTFYIDNIKYTGNLTKGDAPFAEIDFVYQDYNKGFKGYMAGAHVYHNKLLERIDSTIDGASYRSYFLDFENSNFIEERTLMTSVQECSNSNANRSDCLPATTFNWQRPALSSSSEERFCESEPGMEDFCYYQPVSTNFEPFNHSAPLATSTDNEEVAQVFDINGDGFHDLIYVSDNAWKVKLGPEHNVETFLTSKGAGKKEYALNIDYNGDGVRDLLVADSDTTLWHAISYEPTEVSFEFCLPPAPCDEHIKITLKKLTDLGITATGLEGAAQIMDVDGDGMEDIVFHQAGQLKAHINDGDGTFTANQVLYSYSEAVESIELNDGFISQTASMKSASAIDINGDGRSDLISKITTNNSRCSRGDFLDQHDCEFDAGGTWITDIKTNYVLLVSSGSVGSPQLTPTQTIGSSASISSLRVADINGDGLSDILYVVNDKWLYRISDGTKLLSPRETHLTTTDTFKGYTQFVDLNADGRADILQAVSTSLWQVRFSRATEGDWVSFQRRGSKSFDKGAVIRFGDVDGDGKLDMLTAKGSTWTKHTNRDGIKEYAINTITNGHGVTTAIDYLPMTNKAVYVSQAADADINSDTFSPVSGMQLVSRVESGVNTNSKVAVEYQYGGMLIHKKGRGSLGFQFLRTIDKQSGVVSETQYNQNYNANNFAIARMPLYSQQTLNGQLLSSAKNTLGIIQQAGQGGVFPYILASTEENYVYGTNGFSTLVSKIHTVNEYDNNLSGGWGNLTKNTVKVTDVATSKTITTVTTNNFGNANQQKLGRLQSTEVSKTRDGKTVTRKSSFGYNSDNMLQTSVVSPNSLATKLTTTYDYDSYGNKISVNVTGYATASGSNQTRTSSTAYDSRGLYVKSKTNSLGERISYKYNGSENAATGLISSITETGPNSLSQTTFLDSFGQTTKTTGEDSTIVTIGQGYCSTVSCEISNAYYKVTKTITGAPDQEAYFDKWGREIAAQVRDFDDYWLTSITTYDNQGRKKTVSEPGSTNYFTTFNYDELGRITQVNHPNSTTTTQSVNGLISSTTNDLGQVSKTISNGFGETAKTEDMLGNTVEFTYDAFGNLLTSTTTAENKTSVVKAIYDDWGRKIKTIDPIKGTWNYTYNAFGELYTQKTARNHTFTFAYDELGRKVRSYEPSEGTLCWNYATTGTSFNKAIGKLISTAKYAGSNVTCDTNTAANIKKLFTYDDKGRANGVTTTINSANYVQSQSYDEYSRPLITTYPTGEDIFKVKNVYNTNGYLTDVFDDSNSGNSKKLKTIAGLTDRGQIESQTLGNGVTEVKSYYDNNGWFKQSEIKSGSTVLNEIIMTYDGIGNVKSRLSNYAGSYAGSSASETTYTESYSYDDLNRLTSRDNVISTGAYSLPNTFTNQREYKYDDWGNFTFKTGAGHYKYHATKVHELLGVYSDSGNTEGNELYQFVYDDNGNVTSDGNRNFTYGSFDKPTLITGGGASSSMKYGVSRELYYKEDCYHEEGVMVTTKTTYLGNYEKVEREGGAGDLVEHKYYIGDIIHTQRDNDSSDTLYLHKDHQGSVVATTNESGKVVSQAIYDPFGKRTSIYIESVLSSYTEPTDRGYTGHKHISALDIIHMKGRIYDPTLGRMLQADPFIQAPLNSQNYNRYSYVINNPMSYTDPSGFNFFKDLVKAVGFGGGMILSGGNPIGGFIHASIDHNVHKWVANSSGLTATGALVVGIATAYGCGPCSIGFSALYSSNMASYNGASTSEAFHAGGRTAAVSGVFYGIGQTFNASTGFYETGGVGHIATHAVVGGIISVAQGGKFGHGFFSAGFTKYAGGFIPQGGGLGGIAVGTIASAVIGGTASVISGGKFANGAYTGAFQYLFNAALSKDSYKVNKQIVRRVVKEGIVVSSIREVGEAKWESLETAGPLLDKLAGMKSFLSLGVKIDLLTQEYGIYEQVEIYNVEYTYIVADDYSSVLLNVGAQVATGNTSWLYTGVSTGFSVIDIRGCIVSCSNINKGVFGNGVN